MSKFLTIPEDVVVELDADRVSDPPKYEKLRFTFVRYFIPFLLDEPSVFGDSRTNLFMSADIEAKLQGKGPRDVVELGDAEHAQLMKAAEKRSYQQGQTIWRRCVSFFRALENATDKPPAHAAIEKPVEQKEAKAS